MLIRDYRALLKYGDIKKICEVTGYSPYLIKTRLAAADEEMIEVVEAFYAKKIEQLKNSIYDYQQE
jgi:hypothetical protein